MAVIGWPKTLAWSTFGKPVKAVPATDTSGHTDCHIEINISASYGTTGLQGGPYTLTNVKVTITLDSHLTWVMDGVSGSSNSVAVLSHEQGHYDIGGITARDVETALNGLSESSIAALLSSATTTTDSITTSGQASEVKYDSSVANGGTDHGNDVTQQATWKSKIAAATSLSDLP